MEEVLSGLGIAALVGLALAGAVIGFGIAKVMGRSGLLGAVIGAVAAIATPFLLALLGVTALAAGGLLLVALIGAIGAAVVVAAVMAIMRR